MALHEMPLMVFTFLMQVAIGAFIAIEVIRAAGSKNAGCSAANGALNKVEYVAFVVAAVGMLASFFHLKVPVHAPFALTNIATSWMTREIWMAVIFLALFLVCCIVSLRKPNAGRARTALAVCTGVAGLVLVFCMASAYMNEAHPSWNTPATILTFYATVFLVGPVLAAALYSFFAAAEAKKDAAVSRELGMVQSGLVKFAAAVSMIALAVTSIATTLSLCSLASSGELAALSSVIMLTGEFGVLFAARLILVFAGVFFAGLALYVNLSKGSDRSYGDAWITIALVLLIVGEFIGRGLFYASAVQIGF